MLIIFCNLTTLANATLYAKLISDNDVSCKEMLILLNYMMIFSASTAECERGFSTMNLFKASTRCCLNEETLDALMCVKKCGPVNMKNFDPAPHVESWREKSTKKRHTSRGNK